MLRAVIEPAIPRRKLPLTHTLDRAATRRGITGSYSVNYVSLVSNMCHCGLSFSQLPITFRLLSEFCESHCMYYLCVQVVVPSKFVELVRNLVAHGDAREGK